MTAPTIKNWREDVGDHSTHRPTAIAVTLSHTRGSLESRHHPLSGRIFTRTWHANPPGMEGTDHTAPMFALATHNLTGSSPTRPSYQGDQTTSNNGSAAPRVMMRPVYPSSRTRSRCHYTQRTRHVWIASAKARVPIPEKPNDSRWESATH
jgi:hypothetical protein